MICIYGEMLKLSLNYHIIPSLICLLFGHFEYDLTAEGPSLGPVTCATSEALLVGYQLVFTGYFQFMPDYRLMQLRI